MLNPDGTFNNNAGNYGNFSNYGQTSLTSNTLGGPNVLGGGADFDAAVNGLFTGVGSTGNLANSNGMQIGGGDGNIMGNFLSRTDADGNKIQGWGGMALGAAQGIGNLWMGKQQFDLAKDQLKNNKRQFALNFGASANTTNANMFNKQQSMKMANPSLYGSTADHMNKYEVKGGDSRYNTSATAVG